MKLATLMQNRKFSEPSWAIYFALVFSLTFGEVPCAPPNSPGVAAKSIKVQTRQGEPLRKIRTKVQEKTLLNGSTKTWPYMYWGETIVKPAELHLKDNIKYNDFIVFLEDYQAGLILKGNTFDELKALILLYQKFMKSVGESSKMTSELLIEFIISRDVAEDPYNTVTLAHQLIDDFSNKLEGYITDENIKQQINIIAVCADIPTENIDNYYNTSDFPDEDDCLLPYDVLYMPYKIGNLNKPGFIILDPFRFRYNEFQINHSPTEFTSTYIKFDCKEHDLVPDKSLLYYVKRPSFTQITSSVNLVNTFKKIVTYNRYGATLASVGVNIEANPTVKIHAATGKQVEFLLNNLKFKEPISYGNDGSNDHDKNGPVFALNDPAVNEDGVCLVCGRKSSEFESDEKCHADHCLTKAIIQDVEKVFWPNSNGQVLIKTLFHLREIVNDSHFLIAFRINKRWLIQRFHQFMQKKQAKNENIEKPIEADKAPTPILTQIPTPIPSPIKSPETEPNDNLKKVPGKTSQLISEITAAVQDEKKMTKLAAFLIVLFPVILAMIK